MKKIFQHLSLLQGLDKKATEALESNLSQMTCKRGKFLFREGDASNGLYMLVSGELDIQSGGKSIGHLNAGKSVGEMGTITDQPRSADVVALQDCELLFLSQNDLNSFIQQYPSWGLQIYKNVIIFLSSNLKDKNFIFEAERLLDEIDINLDE